MIVYEIGVGYSASFLHFVMFLPVLRGLGSDAQLDRWLADAEGLNIWGCCTAPLLGLKGGLMCAPVVGLCLSLCLVLSASVPVTLK